jgi:hypothetical protein
LLAALAGVASAHQQGVSYSDVEVADGRARYDLTIANHDLRDVDADGDGAIRSDEVLAQYPALRRLLARSVGVAVGGVECPLTLEDFLLDPTGGVTFRLRGPCPDGAPLKVACMLLASTGSQGYNLAKIRYRGGLTEHVFTRNDAELTIGAAAGAGAVLRRFIALGIEHIATGYDHMLFLLALLLGGGGLPATIGIVTAFTVAHSVTLALATFDLVTLPGRLVESAIALSIAWVALENLVFERARGRWRIAFLFGLVHGFGFASILRGMHLPAQGLALSLLAFNLGVEAGQVAVVVLAWPLLLLVERSRRRTWLVRGASAAILVLALYWLVERAFLG